MANFFEFFLKDDESKTVLINIEQLGAIYPLHVEEGTVLLVQGVNIVIKDDIYTFLEKTKASKSYLSD